MTSPLFFFSLFVTATLTPNGNNVAPPPPWPPNPHKKKFQKIKTWIGQSRSKSFDF